jgi:restriction system protein
VPIPDFQTLMLPLLRLASDGEEHGLHDAREVLAREFRLTDTERAALLPSGRQAVFDNRVAWAKVYLQRAGVLDSPRRACFRISDRGRDVLRDPPDRITVKYLERFPEFIDFRYAAKERKETSEPSGVVAEDGETPEETLETAYQRLRGDMAAELLRRVKGSSPQFFERLVVEVLLSMGYGGSRKEAGEAIGRAGDEGIDGIINEDRLGLDVIYLQAKKWDGTVGRPEIQKFVGALHGKRAKKGIFITTGAFSSEAVQYVAAIDPKVVLIDGQQLAGLMIDFNVGVSPVASYEIKRIDSDYFGEE